MKEGYKLILDVWTAWKCNKCGARQEAVENEEWPQHCEEAMKMVCVRKLRAEPDLAAPTQNNTPTGKEI